MPSDSPPHPSSSGPEQPRAESDAGVPAPETMPTASAQRRRHNPRVTAALCYAVPYIVAVVALLRGRRNRFVRFHAA